MIQPSAVATAIFDGSPLGTLELVLVWVAGALLAAKSVQPTTPATNGVSRARSSSQRVSAAVGAACTRIVRPMPWRARAGARSPGPKSRWIGPSAGVSQP